MERHVLTSSLPTTAVALLLIASGMLAASSLAAYSSTFQATSTDDEQADAAYKSRSRHRVARHRRALA